MSNYFLSNKVFFDYNELKNHFLGWILVGDNDELSIKNKNDIYDINTIGCVFQPIDNSYNFDYDNNQVVFKGAKECVFLSNIKISNAYALLIDYGETNININDEIINSESNKKWCSNRQLKIIYSQLIDDKDFVINKEKITDVLIGEIKVKLRDLEK